MCIRDSNSIWQPDLSSPKLETRPPRLDQQLVRSHPEQPRSLIKLTQQLETTNKRLHNLDQHIQTTNYSVRQLEQQSQTADHCIY